MTLSQFEFDPPSMKRAFCEINDEIFEGDNDGLEEEEFERAIYDPFLEHEVTGAVEEPREEEADIELGVGRPVCTARELQNLVRNELSQSSGHLISMKSSEKRGTAK